MRVHLLGAGNESLQQPKRERDMTLIDQIRETARKRAAYKRTVAELTAMPRDVALDLGLYPGDAEKIAHRAVYGH
jgi:uncharacterized protein YjiS (DUF1127 family)